MQHNWNRLELATEYILSSEHLNFKIASRIKISIYLEKNIAAISNESENIGVKTYIKNGGKKPKVLFKTTKTHKKCHKKVHGLNKYAR